MVSLFLSNSLLGFPVYAWIVAIASIAFITLDKRVAKPSRSNPVPSVPLLNGVCVALLWAGFAIYSKTSSHVLSTRTGLIIMIILAAILGVLIPLNIRWGLKRNNNKYHEDHSVFYD